MTYAYANLAALALGTGLEGGGVGRPGSVIWIVLRARSRKKKRRMTHSAIPAPCAQRPNALKLPFMDQLPEAQAQTLGVKIIDRDNPRSVINLVIPQLAAAIEKHTAEKPEYFDKDERALFKFLRKNEETPSPTDNMLRLKFWVEYGRAQDTETRMNFTSIVHGIVSHDYFFNHYLKHPGKVAWLLCQPISYTQKVEEALEFGVEQLRDILMHDHEVNGRIDTKLGELKAKIVAMLDARVKGAVVQRSMNVQVHTSNAQVAKMATAASMEDLQKHIQELDRRAKRAQNKPIVIEGEKVGESGSGDPA